MGARKWAIGGFLAAAVVVVGLGLSAYRAQEKREKATVDVALADALARAESLGIPVYADHLRTDPVPDEENAWVEISAIQELASRDEEGWRSLRGLYPGTDQAAFMRDAPELLMQWSAVFDLIDEVVKKPSYDPGRKWEEGIGMLQSDLATFKSLVIVCTVKSRFELRSGEFAESLLSLEQARSLAQLLSEASTVIGEMVYAMCEAIVAKEIVLQAQLVESEDHRAALREILEELHRTVDVRTQFAEEVVVFVEWVRTVSDRNEYGNELRDGFSEDSLSPLAAISGLSLPDRPAREFEVRAIQAACDYYEALSPETGDYVKNDAELARLLDPPPDWAVDGFPYGFMEIYFILHLSEPAYSQRAKSVMGGEVYKLAFGIVTGAVELVDGTKRSSKSLPSAEFEYLEYESGFSITVSAPDLDPFTLKFDRP